MAYVAPDLTAALNTAAAANGWNAADRKQASDWLGYYFEAVSKAPAGTAIRVMNKKADDLWHVFVKDPGYNAWSTGCFGSVLLHVADPPRRKPTAAENATAQQYYSHWPVPDSIVSCFAAMGG